MFTIFLNNEEISVAVTKRDALHDAKALAHDMFISDVIAIAHEDETVCSFNGSVLY